MGRGDKEHFADQKVREGDGGFVHTIRPPRWFPLEPWHDMEPVQSLRTTEARQTHTWYMLVRKLDVDDIIARLRRAVGDLASAILHVLTINVHLAGAFNGQAKTSIAWKGTKEGFCPTRDSSRLQTVLHQHQLFRNWVPYRAEKNLLDS